MGEATEEPLFLLRIVRRVNGVVPRLLLVVVLAACLAAPASAQGRYGGIGAFLPRFNAQHPHGAGTPPVGVAYYRADALTPGRVTFDPSVGRVVSYHVVLNPQSTLSDLQLERLVTAKKELPADAKQIKGWQFDISGSARCAVYKSRWLNRVLIDSPYVIAWVSTDDRAAGAWVSTAPFCRG
jgi:hypothetical protein